MSTRAVVVLVLAGSAGCLLVASLGYLAMSTDRAGNPTGTASAAPTTAVAAPTASTSAASPEVTVTGEPDPRPPAPKSPASPGQHTDPRYGTCRAVRAHGYGPYYRGIDPEYSWYIDTDNDGVACE